MIPTFLIPSGIQEIGRLVLVAALVAGAAAPLAYCEGKDTAQAQYEAALHKANNRFLQQKARADELAADQRLADHVAVNAQEKELLDAIHSVPDEAPDAVRVRLGCQRLRASGAREDDLPAACRFSG